ncbi:hypothetical protein [Microbacterium sp.]|uniref:hypothetical protein n=1 Tax=Microbacterium sp. TaxID=51671 RepID=UPI0039E66DB8
MTDDEKSTARGRRLYDEHHTREGREAARTAAAPGESKVRAGMKLHDTLHPRRTQEPDK